MTAPSFIQQHKKNSPKRPAFNRIGEFFIFKVENLLSLYQPFTPPSATPAMMYFDKRKYTTSRGSTVRKSPRYTEPYSVLYISPFRSATIIGIVNFSFFVRSIDGRNNWFQLDTNEKIACVAIAGFIIGSAI